MMVDEDPTDSPVGSEETVTRSDLEADILNKGQHTLVVNCYRQKDSGGGPSQRGELWTAPSYPVQVHWLAYMLRRSQRD